MNLSLFAIRFFGPPTVLGVALLLGIANAQSPAITTQNNDPLNALTWSFDGQAFAYGQALTRTPNSPLNPGNAFAQLAGGMLTGELRPNVKATSTYLDLILRPRITSVFQTGGIDERESVRGFIQEGFVRAKPNNDISMTLGRELMTWGPAFFRSPSNPYYFNNARLDPIRELSGLDLARISYSVAQKWSLSGGIIFHSGQDLVANDPYRSSLLVKADYHGTNYLGSLVLASLRSQQAFFGGYTQATVNDAMLIYGEFGTSSSSGVDILPSGQADFYRQIPSAQRMATALIGGSYTFENGHSIYTEYLYNGFGYNSGQLKQYFRNATAASGQQRLGGSLAGLATQNIGYAATRSQDLLGQHYLYLQYQNNPVQGNTLWRLMAGQNLFDWSAQLSFYLEQGVSDRASLFALGIANIGSHDSEFGAVFRQSLTLGVKFFLF